MQKKQSILYFFNNVNIYHLTFSISYLFYFILFYLILKSNSLTVFSTTLFPVTLFFMTTFSITIFPMTIFSVKIFSMDISTLRTFETMENLKQKLKANGRRSTALALQLFPQQTGCHQVQSIYPTRKKYSRIQFL